MNKKKSTTEKHDIKNGYVVVRKNVISEDEKQKNDTLITSNTGNKVASGADTIEGVNSQHKGSTPIEVFSDTLVSEKTSCGKYPLRSTFSNSMAKSRYFSALFAEVKSPFPEFISNKLWSTFRKKWLTSKKFAGPYSVALRLPDDDVHIISFIRRYCGCEKLIFGFDTEWFNDCNGVRVVLSYQFSTRLDGYDYDFVFFPNSGISLSLGEMIYWIVNNYLAGFGFLIASHRKKHVTSYFESCRVVLVGHFLGVDLSLVSDCDNILKYKGLSASQISKRFKDYQELMKLRSLDSLTEEQEHDCFVLEERIQYIDDNPEHSSNIVALNKHCLYTTNIPRYLHYRCSGGFFVEYRLDIRDSMLICDGKSGLSVLGDSLGIPKLDTTELDRAEGRCKNFYKTNMDVLLDNHPDFYLDYSIRDARITYVWYTLFVSILGDAVTTSSASARHVVKNLMKYAVKYREIDPTLKGRALVDKYVRGFSVDKKDHPNYSVFWNSRGVLGDLPDRAYFGGRNECFSHGIVTGRSCDFDLRSAYLVGLQLIPDIDWSKDLISFSEGYKLSLSDWNFPTQIGFGYVYFKFPADVQYPCIPLKSGIRHFDDTPVFLLEGSGLVSAPDVYAALIMGAEVSVCNQGFFFIDCDSDFKVHPLGTIVKDIVVKRFEMIGVHGKGSVYELFWKLIGLAVYGKTGQGLHDKMSRNLLTDDMVRIPFCAITDGVIASTVTSIVRQILSLCMYYVDTQGFCAHSCTTDGFITDFPEDRISEIDDFLYNISPLYHSVINNCFDGGSILEVKHRHPNGFFNIKTRGNIGFNDEGVFAKAGYRGDEDFRFSEEYVKRAKLLDLILKRDGRVLDVKPNMLSFREIKDCGFKRLEKLYSDPESDSQSDRKLPSPYKRLSLDMDNKRFITHRDFSSANVFFVHTDDYNGEVFSYNFRSDYGLFRTRPFATMCEFEHYATIYKSFIDFGYNVKNDDDLQTLHYALKYGFPKYKKPKDDDEKFTSKEIISFRRAYVNHKIIMFLDMYFNHKELIKDSFFEGWSRKDFIKIFNVLYGFDIKHLWKNFLRRSVVGFDLKLAKIVEFDIRNKVKFDSYYCN